MFSSLPNSVTSHTPSLCQMITQYTNALVPKCGSIISTYRWFSRGRREYSRRPSGEVNPFLARCRSSTLTTKLFVENIDDGLFVHLQRCLLFVAHAKHTRAEADFQHSFVHSSLLLILSTLTVGLAPFTAFTRSLSTSGASSSLSESTVCPGYFHCA